LLSLGRTEVMELSEEQGLIMIHCQFCAQEYRFTATDVTQLFDPPQPLLH